MFAFFAGALGAFALAPFSFTPAIAIPLCVAVWLIDGDFTVRSSLTFDGLLVVLGDIEIGSGASWEMATTTFSHQDALGLAYSGIRATNEAERIRATRTLAQGYSFISYATGLIGLARMSEAYHRRALQAAQSADSPIAAAETLLNRGVMLTSIGRWEDASEALEAAADQYGRLGSRSDQARALSVRAYVHFQSAEFESAHRLWGEVGALGSDSGLVKAWVVSGQGRSLARMGRLSEAIGTLRAGRTLIDDADASAARTTQ